MQVTGKNLLNVCKLLFALSRVESNDEYFTFVPVTGLANGFVLICKSTFIMIHAPLLFDKVHFLIFSCPDRVDQLLI